MMLPKWPPQSRPIQLLATHSDLTFNTIIPLEYAPRVAPQLVKAFKECYDFFCRDIAIPRAALAKLSEFTLSTEQFYALVIEKELPKGRFIYLENGQIKFDEWTMPPHAEIIGEVMAQISRQDVMHLWESGSGGSTYVFMSMLMICRRKFNPRSGQATGCSLDHQSRKVTEPAARNQHPGHQSCRRRYRTSIDI